jgi:hypothetical protein
VQQRLRAHEYVLDAGGADQSEELRMRGRDGRLPMRSAAAGRASSDAMMVCSAV